MRIVLRILVAGVVGAMAPAIAASSADMHPLNDGYVIATLHKYVGPEMYVCLDEMVNAKKNTCNAQADGVSAQQYLDVRFGINLTRAVGIRPASSAGKVVILYQINRRRMDGYAAY